MNPTTASQGILQKLKMNITRSLEASFKTLGKSKMEAGLFKLGAITK